MSHPNVIEMKESFETDYYIYIVMEQIRGGDLFTYSRQYNLSENQIARIMHQILQALKYIHSCGVVHRDIKPENILIEIGERAQNIQRIKLSDFGLSQTIIPNQRLT